MLVGLITRAYRDIYEVPRFARVFRLAPEAYKNENSLMVGDGVRCALALAVSALLAAPAVGQIAESVTGYGRPIEEIIVVGARLPRPVQDVIGTVDVITRQDLTDSLTVDLADTVRYTPGVSVANADPRFGAAEFTIRGLSGNRVLSLMDGVRINDQFDIGAFANAGQDYLISTLR